MKAIVALILLVQLPIHKAVPAVSPPPLGCDDPESEAAAEAAVSYINGHSHHGYKFALNRIENIRVIPQVSEELEAERCVSLEVLGSDQPSPAKGCILTRGRSAWLC